MAAKTVIIAALAAFVAAIPQHAEHMGTASIARRDQAFAHSDLAGRTISYDGSCGSWSGMTCPGSNCCSSLGWCGSTPLHCGTGCQAGFGQCGSSDEAQSPAPAPAHSPAPYVAAPAPAPAPEVETSSSSSSTSTTTSTSITSSSTTSVAAVATDLAGVQGAQNKGADQKPGFPHEIPTTTTSTIVAPVITSQAAPAASPASQSSGQSSGLGDSYKMYTGDGSLAAGWPAQSLWVDFDTAFENNRGLLKQSCAQFGAANNNDDEINNLKSALQSVAASTGVDSRFLLAIAMQESGGCVRAPTTNYGVRNPGIFQSHDGAGTCNNAGSTQNPCPQSEITQMVTDGAAGTAAGDGLKQTLAQAGTSDVSKYYRAARIYNSGSIAASGQLQDGIATHCYSSDVANRLTGWVYASHGCTA